MDISNLKSSVNVQDPSTGPMSADSARQQQHTFRHLLGCVAGSGGLLVDLGDDACIFAKIARDDGYAVTAVDARIASKPPQEELDSIRFVQSDVRRFDVTGFDVIVSVGLLHRFELDDQMRMLERCARADVPVILETQIHVGGLVLVSEASDGAQNLVARGPYEGTVTAEGDPAMAGTGNTESFRPTEESILRMFADAGFKKVAIVDPILTSKSGTSRFFLLNCENSAKERPADIVKGQRNYITGLVDRQRFDEAREIFQPIASVPTGNADWLFELAVARMQLHFGEHEKAVATAVRLRDSALGFVKYAAPALVKCARFFDAAGAKIEAEKTKNFALDRLGNAEAIKMLVRTLIQAGTRDDARSLLAGVEGRFTDRLDMLDVAAQGYQQLGDFEAAERVWRSAMEREPQNAALLESVGAFFSGRDKPAEAATALERALALDPENTNILERLIPIYFKLKRIEETERHARTFLSVSPDNARIHYYLASALRLAKRRQEAFEHAKRAAELDPANERYRQYADDLAKVVARKAGEAASSGAEPS